MKGDSLVLRGIQETLRESVKHQQDDTWTVCSIATWACGRHTHTISHISLTRCTASASPCAAVGRVEFLVDWQHSCTPFVWSERRLMGQRARGGERGEGRREMLAESPSPPLSRTGSTTSSSLLRAALPRPSAILERGKKWLLSLSLSHYVA